MNGPQSRLAMLVIVWLAAGAISVAAQSVNVPPGQSGPVGSQGMSPTRVWKLWRHASTWDSHDTWLRARHCCAKRGKRRRPRLIFRRSILGNRLWNECVGKNLTGCRRHPSFRSVSISIVCGSRWSRAGGRTTNSSSAGSSPGAGSAGTKYGNDAFVGFNGAGSGGRRRAIAAYDLCSSSASGFRIPN